MKGLEQCLHVLEQSNKLDLLQPIQQNFFNENISPSLHESFDFTSSKIIQQVFPNFEVNERSIIHNITNWYEEAKTINDFLLTDTTEKTRKDYSITLTDLDTNNYYYSLNLMVNNWLGKFKKLVQESNGAIMLNEANIENIKYIITLIFTLLEIDNKIATRVFNILSPYISKNEDICQHFFAHYGIVIKSNKNQKNKKVIVTFLLKDYYLKEILLPSIWLIK